MDDQTRNIIDMAIIINNRWKAGDKSIYSQNNKNGVISRFVYIISLKNLNMIETSSLDYEVFWTFNPSMIAVLRRSPDVGH